MRLCVLASGSKGNCIWVEEERRAVLLDNGLSYKEFSQRAKAVGLNQAFLKDVAVSHEHSDHVKGIGPLARKLKLTVHMTEGAAEAADQVIGEAQVKTFQAGDEISLGPLRLKTVTGSHDCRDPVVFVVSGAKKSVGVVTDLGAATNLVRGAIKDVDALVLESNHDLTMLLNGPYPLFLKQRVRSRQGHLSNEQAGDLLKEVCHSGLGLVVLAHLSEVNNTPELAKTAALKALKEVGHRPTLAVASQNMPTKIFEF
ncbi:MAG: MBL fold metallo-hydrolase [Deltaproteobacteria bacterium]|jgi:phosphoribosyl 1,2-cyclic phosphodiesterase|nr:MBL fold metallo-hydrolase [Deltaproteobacteria bacterium]